MNRKTLGIIVVSVTAVIFLLLNTTTALDLEVLDDLNISSNIKIQISISPDLADDIEIISIEGKRPGKFNPVETVVTLKNTSNSEKNILAKGDWRDARGNAYGGHSFVRIITPGVKETFETGTRSKNASVYKFTISANDKTQDQLLTESLANTEARIAEGQGMTYTETPTDIIPPWTPRGVANGEPFTAEVIMFRQDFFPDWRLSISDKKFDILKGPGFERFTQKDLQTIYIDLPHEPKAGSIFKKEMSYGGGIFQIKPSPSAFSTTSWNTSIAYYIEITEWNKKASSGFSCNSMQAETGTASGRLYISFQGPTFEVENGLKDSWISGAFKDAPIVYCEQ